MAVLETAGCLSAQKAQKAHLRVVELQADQVCLWLLFAGVGILISVLAISGFLVG